MSSVKSCRSVSRSPFSNASYPPFSRSTFWCAMPSPLSIDWGPSSRRRRGPVKADVRDGYHYEAMTYDERVAEFKARIDAGEKIEAGDWMPDEYRQAALKFIEMHANSEVMGALPEREWIPRAPTLKRKLSLTAKVQDEVGHGQILYRVAEDLGKTREQMFDDLVNGRTKFHNVFHYPTYTWGDVAVIGWLIDGAALVTQKALLDSSYAPYVRAMRRICAEESLHLRHGEDLALELVSGTDEQREMFQGAVNRWWRPIMHFYGPPSNSAKNVLLHCGIETRTNEDLRQVHL